FTLRFFTVLFFLSPALFFLLFFFYNAPPPTEIYTLSLHDALPILFSTTAAVRDAGASRPRRGPSTSHSPRSRGSRPAPYLTISRSEEHTSELQSPYDLVCRLLLEKKKKKQKDKSKILTTNTTQCKH